MWNLQAVYAFMGFLSIAMVTVESHLCLISPGQRGKLADLNQKAQDECLQLKGPCGQVAAPAYPRAQYIVSEDVPSNLTVVFQKNLDHYNKAKPGYFSVSFGKKLDPTSQNVSFSEVMRFSDSTTPSLHLYEVSVKLPAEPFPWYVLQVSYVTNNPSAPAAFYQCADLSVIRF